MLWAASSDGVNPRTTFDDCEPAHQPCLQPCRHQVAQGPHCGCPQPGLKPEGARPLGRWWRCQASGNRRGYRAR
jgi:hypothetical protein